MGKTVSQTLNDLMPTAFNKEDEVYKAIIGDADTDTGALTNELKEITEFINYYTRTQKVDDANTSLLAFIVSIFSGLKKHYSETDSSFRLRYKALIERQGTNLWNGKKSIRSIFTYFFPEKDVYLIERYPVNNLVQNGDFDTLESWVYNDSDTEFKLINSRSFNGVSAMYVNPHGETSVGYMEQQIPSIVVGKYEFLFFFSSPKKGIGDVQFSIRDGSGKYWNGTSWVSTVYDFYEKADIDTPGYYKPVQKTVAILETSSITIRFKNLNGNGVLIDSVRFGKISEPAFRIYIVAELDLLFDGSVKADKKYNFSGFKEYYIQSDMDDILQKVKPAGVYAEMTLLSNRMGIPWDMVLLQWETEIQLTRKLYFDGNIEANGKFNFSGEAVGITMGYSYMEIIKNIPYEEVL